MTEQTELVELRALKRRLSDRLLSEPGVSGVGVQSGRVTVYMADESAPTVAKIKHIVRSLIGDAASQVSFLVTGAFRAR